MGGAKVAWWVPLSMLWACGGQADSQVPAAAGKGDDGSAGVAGSGGGDTNPGAMVGGSSAEVSRNTAGSEDSNGAPHAAGGAHDVPLLIPSGTRSCQDAGDCLGIECAGSERLPLLICAVRCPTGEECRAREVCLATDQLEATCLQRCQSPTDCAFQFDCFDLLQDGVFACVPSPWATVWDR